MITFAPIDEQLLAKLIKQETDSTSYPWSVNMLRDSLEANVDCQQIGLAEEIIGYWVVQQILPQAEILNIVIFTPFQAQGYGRLAMQKLQSYLATAGVEEIFLEVRSSNRAARALYAKTGFEQVGVRRHYYRPRSPNQTAEDALVMSCELNLKTYDLV